MMVYRPKQYEPLPAIQSVLPKKKTIKKKVLRFENKEEDGYKIGFFPTIPHKELNRSGLPHHPQSLSKMERLLDIKATVSGRNK
jgi:hypothetical protein